MEIQRSRAKIGRFFAGFARNCHSGFPPNTKIARVCVLRRALYAVTLRDAYALVLYAHFVFWVAPKREGSEVCSTFRIHIRIGAMCRQIVIRRSPEGGGKGGKSGNPFWEITLTFAIAPLPSTMTIATIATTITVTTIIDQKTGPFLDQLSRSRSKFPLARSTPTPTNCCFFWGCSVRVCV